jgi:hypothetical protein
MLTRIERSRDQIAGPTADFQSKVRTEGKAKSITASIAVICAFAAMGMLATNIFLPSLAALSHVHPVTVGRSPVWPRAIAVDVTNYPDRTKRS